MLVFALRDQFTQVRAFTFVDQVHEVTDHFRPGADLVDVLADLAASAPQQAALWGRTNYGRAFTKFLEEYADALGPKSSLLILGDARSNYSDLALDQLRRRWRRRPATPGGSTPSTRGTGTPATRPRASTATSSRWSSAATSPSSLRLRPRPCLTVEPRVSTGRAAGFRPVPDPRLNGQRDRSPSATGPITCSAVACPSGRRSAPRKRVRGNSPRVRIPPPPPVGPYRCRHSVRAYSSSRHLGRSRLLDGCGLGVCRPGVGQLHQQRPARSSPTQGGSDEHRRLRCRPADRRPRPARVGGRRPGVGPHRAPQPVDLSGLRAGARSERARAFRFDDAALAQTLSFAALIVILAEGGLSTRWREIRPSMPVGLSLATIGTLVSMFSLGAIAHFAFGLDWTFALLLGAVTAPTDAAAVFSVLRNVSLPRRLSGALEAESGLNDAPTVLLVTALSVSAGHEEKVWVLALTIFYELVAGVAFGFVDRLAGRQGRALDGTAVLGPLSAGRARVLRPRVRGRRPGPRVRVRRRLRCRTGAGQLRPSTPADGRLVHRRARLDRPDRPVRHARPAGHPGRHHPLRGRRAPSLAGAADPSPSGSVAVVSSMAQPMAVAEIRSS